MLCFRQALRLAWSAVARTPAAFALQLSTTTTEKVIEQSDDDGDFDSEEEESDDDLFAPHPHIPGFYFTDELLSPKERKSLLSLLQQLGKGQAEPFGKGVYASLDFPEEPADFYQQTEAALLPIVNRIRFFDSHPAVGVVILRYDADGSLPPHVDDPDKYGEVVCTIGLGSAAVLQMQNIDEATGKRVVQRVMLDEGSAYVMSEDARYKWLHGIEGGEQIDLGDGFLQRSTRFALLLTPPKAKFSGALLIRHPGFPGGAAICQSEQGGVVVDGPAILPIDEVLKRMDNSARS